MKMVFTALYLYFQNRYGEYIVAETDDQFQIHYYVSKTLTVYQFVYCINIKKMQSFPLHSDERRSGAYERGGSTMWHFIYFLILLGLTEKGSCNVNFDHAQLFLPYLPNVLSLFLFSCNRLRGKGATDGGFLFLQ